MSGVVPGKYGENIHFTEVDSLYVRDDYVADEAGIMHVSKDKVDWFRNFVATSSWPVDSNALFQLDCEYTVWQTAIDWTLLQTDQASGALVNYAREETADSMLQLYIKQGFNDDGFRSIPYKLDTSGKKKVLLIGDSFVFGLSAKPLYNSFSDLLITKGFHVYNAGVVGADPVTYLRTAQRLIPRLNPDIVIVNYFTGNDDLYHYREELPNKTHYHVTNAGWLWATPRGFYMEVNDVYKYVESQVYIPTKDNMLNSFLASSAVGTRCYQAMLKWEWVVNPMNQVPEAYAARDTFQYHEDAISDFYIRQISVLCEEQQSQFALSIIPDYKELTNTKLKERVSKQFDGLPIYYPEELTVEMYNDDPDGHFNNEGHNAYAEHLNRVISALNSD